MTVGQLMFLLSNQPRGGAVKAWDAESEEYEDVTGIVWSEDGSELYIQTDDQS